MANEASKKSDQTIDNAQPATNATSEGGVGVTSGGSKPGGFTDAANIGYGGGDFSGAETGRGVTDAADESTGEEQTNPDSDTTGQAT